MRMFSQQELSVHPVRGPFSHYMTPQETAILIALVKSVSPKVMIEFGCNRGMTAKRLLDNVSTLEKYIGIDVPSDYSPTLACQSTEVPEEAGIFAADDDRFWLLTLSGPLILENLEPCDAVFIDGDHSGAAVTYDSRLARSLIRPGGIICWHDFQNPAVEVTPALCLLADQGWPIDYVENSWLAFMRVE